MIKHFKIIINWFVTIKNCFSHFKKQYKYEIVNVTHCNKSGKALLEIKVINKSQSFLYLAEEVAADNDFIKEFSPLDIRSISFYATSDKYENILEAENIKKSFELLRSTNINGNKAVQVRNKVTNEYHVILLKDFIKSDLLEKLNFSDVYQIGYLAGLEHGIKSASRLGFLKSKEK